MSKNTLIIPVAADRPEYERYLPEWLDIHPVGTLMLYECVRGLPLSEFERICPVILEKHDARFHAAKAIDSQFRKVGLGQKVDVVRLKEPTTNQPDTVACAIKAADIQGSIYIKDGDNYFECTPAHNENSVAVYPLDMLKSVNPGNKSYIMVDDNQYVSNIIEKVIIGRLFCAGGYGFEDASTFLTYCEGLTHHKQLFISHIIYAMLLDRHLFRPVTVDQYTDWGTREEWLRFKSQFVTLFVPLASLFTACSSDASGDAAVKVATVRELDCLYVEGKTKIIILSEQHEDCRAAAEEKLRAAGIRYHQLLCGVFPSSRIYTEIITTTDTMVTGVPSG